MILTPEFSLFSLRRVSLDTWTFQLLTSTCPPNLKGFFKWHTHMHICMHQYTHAHPHSETHTNTNTNAHSIERLARRSCQCGFIFLADWHVLWNAPTRTHVHTHTEWLYLSPLLNSITFTSFCSACQSPLFFFCRQLNGLLWDFVKCVCEKGFSACCLAPLCPPSTLLSCSGTVEMIHCICLWLCVFECAWVSVYTAARPHSTFTQKKIVFSSSLPFALLSGSFSVTP